MQTMDIGTFSWLVTICLFGAVGWMIAISRRQSARPIQFVVLLGVAVGGYFIGTRVIVFGVDEFKIFLNWIIVSACLGGCAGLLVRNRKLRRLEKA